MTFSVWTDSSPAFPCPSFTLRAREEQHREHPHAEERCSQARRREARHFERTCTAATPAPLVALICTVAGAGAGAVLLMHAPPPPIVTLGPVDASVASGGMATGTGVGSETTTWPSSSVIPPSAETATTV